MQNYNLVCTLGSPLVMKHQMTLDAAIGGMLFQKGVPGEKAARTPGFFDEWNGVPQASFLFFKRHPEYLNDVVNVCMNAPFQKGISERSTKVPDLGGFAKLTAYESIFSSEEMKIEFFFRGDANRVVDLFKEIGSIGAFTRKGHGEITNIECNVSEETDEPFGIVRSGKLVRPVPWSLIDDLGVAVNDLVRFRGRYRSPYNPAVALRENYGLDLIAHPRVEMA
jgi:hypothetical protein